VFDSPEFEDADARSLEEKGGQERQQSVILKGLSKKSNGFGLGEGYFGLRSFIPSLQGHSAAPDHGFHSTRRLS
jgi:hypothetical protein